MIRLRELQRGDLPALNQWRNDRDVVAGLGASFAFIGSEVDDAWFSAYLGARQRNVRLAIVERENDVEDAVGVVYLLDISWVHRSAEFALMIGKKDRWGKGIASQAGAQMLRHAFQDLGLNRVWLHVNVDNVAAIKLYLRLGFCEEGLLRSAVYKNGGFVDVKTMAILKNEYQPTLSRPSD